MYSFEEKEEVIKKFKEGHRLKKVHEETGIPEDVLETWKEEADLILRIKALIKVGNLEEARNELEKLNSSDNEIIKFEYLIDISRLEGDTEGEKNNLREILERKPDDIKSIRKAFSKTS